MKQNKKRQIAKISIFITSIFVIFLSITYAFINMTVTGTKRQVITAGMINVIFKEDNNSLAIENAMPTYDEVGMIQNPFTFQLTNTENRVLPYTLKLVKTDLDNELNESFVRVGLVKNNISKMINTLSLLKETREEETVASTIPREPYRKETLEFCQKNAKSPVSTEEECLTYLQQQEGGSSLKDFNDVIDYYIYELMFAKPEMVQAGTRTKALHYCKVFKFEANYNEPIETEEDCVNLIKIIDENVNNFEDVIELLGGTDALPDNRNKKEVVLEKGFLEAKETNYYELRLWIDANVENEENIAGRTLSYKIEVDVSDSASVVDVIAFQTKNLGESCKTYDNGTDTFLVGQCSKNYIWYSGKLWRAISRNNETGAVKMITDNAMASISYNEDRNLSFENSYMDQWLNQEFLPTLHDAEKFLVTDSEWQVGEVSSNLEAVTNGESTELTIQRPMNGQTVKRTVGLLNAYEYYATYGGNTLDYSDPDNSHLDGYLNNGTVYWLANIFDTSKVWSVNDKGLMNSISSRDDMGVRPSVNLKLNIQITSGDGTEANPYRLEGDSKEAIAGTTLLLTRYSGEYVRFNNELYRIVGVENNATKITAVDPPSTLTSNQFDSSVLVTNFGKASIKTDLENYYQGLDTTAKSMIEPNTIWYLGTVGSGGNYKSSICGTVDVNTDTKTCEKTTTTTTANIGLPRYGEMFTSQITRGTKTCFWTLTISYYLRGNFVWSVDDHGGMNPMSSTNAARLSMYLKQNVVIAKNNTGDGTYEHPYEIELGA